MRRIQNWLAAAAGVACGVIAIVMINGQSRVAHASANDRYQDYVMCTGAVSTNAKFQTDGVWLLDYRGGKLLGTVIDRSNGKISGWAEVDLVSEFGIAPKQDVHFMMTTGSIAAGQSALYVAEVATGKFGVYTMATGDNGGIQIRRHDMTTFRAATAPSRAPIATVGGTEAKQ